MLFRPSRPRQAPHPYAVPSSEVLRLHALRQAWQRGSRVAQRRLAWRWLLWALPRYILPALAAVAVPVGLVLWWQAGHLPPLAAPAAEQALPLRPAPRLEPQSNPSPGAASIPAATEPSANPTLKLDSQIHRKEPP